MFMKKVTLFVTAVSTAFVFSTLNLRAAVKYWDTNGATAGAGGSIPSATWNTGAAANWTTDSTGSSAPTTWTAGDIAVFSAGTDATGSFTVTVPSGTTNSLLSITNEEGTILIGPGTIDFGTANG